MPWAFDRVHAADRNQKLNRLSAVDTTGKQRTPQDIPSPPEIWQSKGIQMNQATIDVEIQVHSWNCAEWDAIP